MKKSIQCILCLMLAVLLSGCTMRTVDQMYQLPKRSEDYSDLQSAIDKAMVGLSFSAPIAGDNQQSVQMADVDGDGVQEYLVFTKGGAELPLRILLFDRVEDVFVHADTIESSGASFDQVEYVQMDEQPGLEIVVGCQVSDKLVRSVSVYSFSGGEAEKLVTANYRRFLTLDMDEDGRSELFVLRPNQMETENGVAELYSMKDGLIERTNEATMSCPVDKLKRILVGKLADKKTAVYVASAVDETALITDIFTQNAGTLKNIVQAEKPNTSVQTLRNHYIYADDIDKDGITELPRLVPMLPLEGTAASDPSKLVLWYAMNTSGQTINKGYTYYDSDGGWYLRLDDALAPRLTVKRASNVFEYYLWNTDITEAQKLMTVYLLTTQNREEQSQLDGRFVLLKTDTVVYCAALEAASEDYGITQVTLTSSFNLIQRDWKTEVLE